MNGRGEAAAAAADVAAFRAKIVACYIRQMAIAIRKLNRADFEMHSLFNPPSSASTLLSCSITKVNFMRKFNLIRPFGDGD